jgi:hypothetical protein
MGEGNAAPTADGAPGMILAKQIMQDCERYCRHKKGYFKIQT